MPYDWSRLVMSSDIGIDKLEALSHKFSERIL